MLKIQLCTCYVCVTVAQLEVCSLALNVPIYVLNAYHCGWTGIIDDATATYIIICSHFGSECFIINSTLSRVVFQGAKA